MTKKQALAEALKIRAAGGKAKVMYRSGVYTQPGRGIVAYVEYFVQSSK